MIPEYVRGAIAPVFTAFNADGSLDDAGQCRLLDYLVQAGGVSAYFIRCGMGQMYSFSYDDVRQIAKNACGHMEGRGAVVVGCAGIWDHNIDARPDPEVFTKQAVELSQFAEQCGAAGVVHTVPDAIAPKNGETIADVVLRYFETVGAAVGVPVLLYQPPGTHPDYRVDVDLLGKLADIPAVKAIKVSTVDAGYVLDLTWAVQGKDFAFITGAETAFYAGLCSGSRACIGQGATLNPKIIAAVQNRFERQDYQGAIEAQRAVNLLVEKSPSPIEFFKRYVTESGYPVKPYRRTAGNIYRKDDPDGLKDEDYQTFKVIYEAELEKYA